MRDLFVDKVAQSIARIKSFEPTDGFYVAFSGGKDSIVLLDLVRRSGVKHDVHYSMTTVDPPELIYFIRKNYPECIFEPPQRTMWELIPPKLMPPTRLVRYCCQELKERGGEDRFVLLGIRWAESVKRSNRKMVETCDKKAKRMLSPIIDWTDSDIWEYIRFHKMPYCELYDQGFDRLGCIGCPMAGPDKQRMEFTRWPKYRAGYIRAFDKMLIARKERGLETTWTTGEDVMSWWLKENEKEVIDENQETLL